MPNLKNFAYSTVATAPSPASSGTSLVVQSGDGTKFPSTSFQAVIWPAGAQPTSTNAEVVTVSNISTDTFTITRAQESSSARTVLVGDQIAANLTGGLFPTGTIMGTTDSQTATNKEISGGVVESNVFHDTVTTQTITLPSARTFEVIDKLEIGSSQSVTVPSNSSLETLPAAQKISNNMLDTSVGELGGVWKTWTPTWTNLTLGTGAVTATYTQVGKIVFFHLKLVWTSTTSIGGNVSVSLPVTAATYSNNFFEIAHGTAYDQSANTGYTLVGSMTSTTAMQLFTINAAASASATWNNTTSTVPFTWTTSDEIMLTGFYEAA